MQLLAEGQTPNVLLLAGIALICAVLLFRSQRRIRQAADNRPLPPSAWRPQTPATPSTANSVNPPREAQSWQVEYHEMVREATAKLDNKIRILEYLIRDADARIARLQSVGEWLDRSARLDAEPGEAEGIVLSKLSAGASKRVALAAAEGAQPAADAPVGAALAARPYEEIYALADAGKTGEEIASLLNSPVGEIELILGLRRQR